MALVLTRKPGQSVVIGDGIIVTVAEIRGDQVRLAIVADRSVPVHRSEVLDELAAANRAAASSPCPALPRPALPRPPLPRPPGTAS